jgi:hypothetical protein
MQRFTIRIKNTKKYVKRRLCLGVLFCLSFDFVLFNDSGVRGGGKCPEEEHTTCSGGPTNYNLSQARFMGRENIYKNINILINIK